MGRMKKGGKAEGATTFCDTVFFFKKIASEEYPKIKLNNGPDKARFQNHNTNIKNALIK